MTTDETLDMEVSKMKDPKVDIKFENEPSETAVKNFAKLFLAICNEKTSEHTFKETQKESA